jgi:hypothetical protein
MQVQISSQGHTATFQLYDTDTLAAKEFNQQLPLTLQLSNFRDAQWMLYPPDNSEASSRLQGEVKFELIGESD